MGFVQRTLVTLLSMLFLANIARADQNLNSVREVLDSDYGLQFQEHTLMDVDTTGDGFPDITLDLPLFNPMVPRFFGGAILKPTYPEYSSGITQALNTFNIGVATVMNYDSVQFDSTQIDSSAAAINYIFTGTPTDPISPTIPNNYSLGQNYPNPFNSSTTIPYHIPLHANNSSIEITNMLGQTVTEIPIFSGQTSTTFNGSEFSSGVYFYQLEATEPKKMVLTK
ncbi:T9SS type A sorting domain-containing protein [archaeon]|nr:T9SS type A sorting domain-containing protein [archaeon]